MSNDHNGNTRNVAHSIDAQILDVWFKDPVDGFVRLNLSVLNTEMPIVKEYFGPNAQKCGGALILL